MNYNKKFIYNLSTYILVCVVVLVIEIIFYEYLKIWLPSDTNFLWFPFDLPSFIFGLSFILMVAFLAVICLYLPKTKKRVEKIKEKKRSF